MLNRFALIVLLLLSPAAWAMSGEEGGPSDAAVNESTGAATLLIPIEVPRGTGGFQPTLNLEYSSHAGDGPFGLGWRLQLGEISRATRFGTPSYGTSDQFELDGELLVESTTENDRYHTFTEQFLKIVHTSSDEWRVFFPNGMVAKYGITEDARIRYDESSLGDPIFRWLLEELSDSSGNTVKFVYERAVDEGTAYPKRIEYTYRAGSPIGDLRVVEFLREQRPDPSISFRGAVRSTLTERINEVRVTVGGQPFRRRSLNYDEAPAFTGRSRITSSVLYGTDCPLSSGVAACQGLPPETFAYTDHSDVSGAQWQDVASWKDEIPTHFYDWVDADRQLRDRGVRAGDINGDGLIDLVRANKNEGGNDRHYVWLNTGTGWQYDSTWSQNLGGLRFTGKRLVLHADDPNGEAHDCDPPSPTATSEPIYFSRTGGFDAYEVVSQQGNFQLTDVNGDGRADLVAAYRIGPFGCYSPQVQLGQYYGTLHYVKEVWLNDAENKTWVRDPVLSAAFPSVFRIAMFDRVRQNQSWFNCATATHAQNVKFVCANLGGGLHHGEYRWEYDIGTRLVDLNGDGLLDVVAKHVGGLPWNMETYANGPGPRASEQGVWLNTGSGWEAAPAGYSDDLPPLSARASYMAADTGVRFVDLNGDGLTDIIKSAVDRTGITDTWPHPGAFEDSGVWLNTGQGWCHSSQCPEAARYVLPAGQAFTRNYDTTQAQPNIAHYRYYIAPTGLNLGDLNGDGLVDLMLADYGLGLSAWVQDPGQAGSVWRLAPEYAPPSYSLTFVRFFETLDGDNFIGPRGVFLADFDANGTADLVRSFQVEDSPNVDYIYAYMSNRGFPDRLAQYDNSRGGSIRFEYDSPQRLFSATLDAAAQQDIDDMAQANDPVAAGITRGFRVPVVALRTTIDINSNQGSWAYSYAHQRWCPGHRSSLGFRAVEVLDPVSAITRAFFYQTHGRAGRTSRREVFEGGARRWVSLEDWDVFDGDPTEIPGSGVGTHVGRLVSSTEHFEYADQPGAARTVAYGYDDSYGFNFVGSVTLTRPTGTLVVTRTPVSPGEYLRGFVESEVHTSGGVTFRDIDRAYDTSGRLILAAREIGPRGGASVSQEVIQWQFDQYGNVFRRIDPKGREEQFFYDGDSLPGCTGGGDSAHAMVEAVEDKLDEVSCYVSDATGQPFQISRFNGDLAEVTLDPWNRPTHVYVTPSGGSETLLERRIYSDAALGSPVEVREYIQESPSESTPYVWSKTFLDGFGRVERTADVGPNGNAIGRVFQRDHAGRVTRQTFELDCGTDPLFDCAGLTGNETPAETFQYDALGRLLRHDAPSGTRVAHYRREVRGAALDGVLLRDANGHLLYRLLDGDRVAWVDECQNTPTALDLSDVGCTSPEQTAYAYEPTGEIGTITDAEQNDLVYAYDTLGRVLGIDDPDGGLSQYEYDDAGNILAVTNARQQTTSFLYDALDRLSVVNRPEGTTTTILYDPVTRQRKQVEELDSSMTRIYLTSYEYDLFGREKQRKQEVLGRKLISRFWYDLLGRVKRVEYPTGTDVAYRYAGAYLEEVCIADDCAANPEATRFIDDVQYDALGRPVREDFAKGQLEYDYFGEGPPDARRLQRVQFTRDADSGVPFDLTYSYDANGNVTSVDDQGPGPISADAAYAYDVRNRIASRTLGGVTKHYAYDPIGNLVGYRLDSAGAPPNQLYDDPARPHAVTKNRAEATYDYDADGNVTRRGGQYLTYDAVNRLVCVGDAASPCTDPDVEFFYDVDGRVILERRPSKDRFILGDLFAWEPGSSGSQGNGLVNVYAFGRRIAERTEEGYGLIPSWQLPSWPLPGEPRTWGLGALALAFAALLWLLVTSGTAGRIARRPVPAAVCLLVAVGLVAHPGVARGGGGPSATNRWIVSDHLGSSALILNSDGEEVHRTVFEPFGEVFAEGSSPNAASRLYTGQRMEKTSGLYDFKARWYDASSGRFLSIDPIVQAPDDPRTLNPYTYAGNNPVNAVDPNGLGFLDKLLGFFSIVLGVLLLFSPAAPLGLAFILQGGSTLTLEYGGPPELALAFAIAGLAIGTLAQGRASWNAASRWPVIYNSGQAASGANGTQFQLLTSLAADNIERSRSLEKEEKAGSPRTDGSSRESSARFYNHDVVERYTARIEELGTEVDKEYEAIDRLTAELTPGKFVSSILGVVWETDGETNPTILIGVPWIAATRYLERQSRSKIADLERRIDVLTRLRDQELANRGRRRYP